MTTATKSLAAFPYVRLDFRWWTAILILIAVAADWSVIGLVIVLLIAWPIVERFAPMKPV